MDPRDGLRISWRSLTAHPLRSMLTTLGVIIGVASVIAFMVLGGGITADILGEVAAQNYPVMQVSTQTTPEGGTGVRLVDTPIYTATDVAALREVDGVAYVAPIGQLPAVQLTRENRSLTGGFLVETTTADRFAHGAPYELKSGEAFDGPGEAVVSARLAERFETAGGAPGTTDPLTVGDTVTIRFRDGSNTTVTVAGVVNSTLTGRFTQPTLYLPVEEHHRLIIETPRNTTESAYTRLEIRVRSIEELEAVKTAVETSLEDDSDAAALKASDHTIRVQTVQDAVDQITGIIDRLTVFIGGIAAISLLVGAIGIANIMIVSVTERTREIGVMKAIGARRREIVQLFLVESMILGAIGAVVGVVAGIGVGFAAVSYLDWPMVYPLDWIAIAVGVGVGVGVLSGLYPAWRAARIDPIEALRRE